MSDFDKDRLKYLFPLKELRAGERLYLSKTAKIHHMEFGDQLWARDSQDLIVYLLEGKLDLCVENEEPYLLNPDDSKAFHPLFKENELDSHIVAESPCELLIIDRNQFNTLVDQEMIVPEQSASSHISQVDTSIYNEISQAIENSTLKLPSLPEVAIKIKTAAAKEDVGIDDVSRIAESDPAIVARLIQVANSPLSRGVEHVHSIRDAIVRLGLTMTQNLVISLSMKQLFKTDQHILQLRMEELYRHSVEVAAISFALSKKLNRFNPDELLLAGLIHDIGVIPVITYIDETGLEIQSEKEVDSIIAKLRAPVSGLVVKNWDFPEAMVAVCEQAENWFKNNSNEIDLADIVIVAQMYSMLKNKQLDDLPDIKKVPVFKKMFPDEQDPNFVMEVLKEANDEIEEVKNVLTM